MHPLTPQALRARRPSRLPALRCTALALPGISLALPCISLALGALLAACGGADRTSDDPTLIHTVQRGDLSITVRERGELKAARDTRISSELEGRATLIYLIPEGSVVRGGEKVAELDVSATVEKRAQQGINVARAEAALEQARKNVEIVGKELRAAERTAETRLEIARLRLEKFIGQRYGAAPSAGDTAEPAAGTNEQMVARLGALLDSGVPASAAGASADRLLDRVLEILEPEENLRLEMGELANQVLLQIDAISLARSSLEMAAQTLFYSEKLAEKGFITSNELERDRLDHQRELSTQTVAWNNLFLLVNYTLPETLLTLRLEVENAELGVESTRAAGEARLVREEAELKSIEAEYELAREQLESWGRQIERGVLRAPGPGLVVYGRWDWDEPVYEGMEVRERQEVIILPDISSMVADIRVPESQIGKLAVGQRAALQVDAFPNRPYAGRVTHVSSLPEPARRSQAVKVYIASVLIEGGNEGGSLRPGMNATVTVETGTVVDGLILPMPALERKGEAHFVWKVTDAGPVAAPVELGAHSLTHVEVLAGLSEGDRVHLVRPPGALLPGAAPAPARPPAAVDAPAGARAPVSYTHLTLPTIYSV